MKIARLRSNNEIFYAMIKNGKVYPMKGLPYQGVELDGRELDIDNLQYLAPVEPDKIVAVGLNYAKHAKEMKEDLPENPIIFIKPNTTVVGPTDGIFYPGISQRVDYEAELAVVIGKTCKDIKEEEAADYIFGYTCLNDVTARDLQKKDGQWTRAKSFDTFCPIGPCIETEYDWKGKSIKSVLNGEIKQDGNTASLIFEIEKLISFISSVMTLKPGDVIATGTPAGIGPMQKGDTIEIMIEGLDTLRNTVI
jgi:2-keto-4-pentenoate hydratase/2-oxohepta-3-ene-1,7-dioic acid hydratase in catechol pathway